MKSTAFLAAAVTAQTFEFGGCHFTEWADVTEGKNYYDNGGMNDTFYQIGSINGLFTYLGYFDSGSLWVPACTRHELIQNEDYPIFRWAVQTQKSLFFGESPWFSRSDSSQWVWKDYSALGYTGNALAGYNSQ